MQRFMLTTNICARLAEMAELGNAAAGVFPAALVPDLVTICEESIAEARESDALVAEAIDGKGARQELAIVRADLDALREQHADLSARYLAVCEELESVGAPQDVPQQAPATDPAPAQQKRRGRPPRASESPQDVAPPAPAELPLDPAPVEPPPVCFAPDRESIRAALVALGRERGLAILSGFGAARFGDIHDADLPHVAERVAAQQAAAA
jgi:hypothetical protein